MPKLVIDDFSGGRNTFDSLDLLQTNQSPDQNNVWTEQKSLSQRRGFTTAVVSADGLSPIPEQLKPTLMAAGSLLRLAMVGRVSAHAQRYLTYTDDGAAFAIAGYTVGTCSTSGSSTTVTGSGTAWTQNLAAGDYFIPAGGSPNKIVSVDSDTQITVTTAVNLSAGTGYRVIQAIAQGSPAGIELFDVAGAQNLFIVDGARAYRYDGTNVYRVDGAGGYSMPTGKILLSHKNYLFCFRANDTDMRWCALKDVTSWPANNSQTLTSVSDPVRAAVVYADSLIVFTRSRMYRILGQVFDPLNPSYYIESIAVPPDFTFWSSRTPVVHQGVLKFLTADGWYGYVGGIDITKLSQRIQPDVDGFRRLVLAPEAMQDAAVSFVYKSRMWCAVPDDSQNPTDTNNTVYMQDENGSWWRWFTSKSAVAGEFTDFALCKFGSTGALQLMAGNAGTNKLATLDTGNMDDGGTIDGYWQSKEFVFPDLAEFIELIVTLKKQSSGNLTVSYSIDRRAFISKTVDMTTGAGTVIIAPIPIGSIGKSIRVKVEAAGSNTTMEVFKLELSYAPTEARRT